MRFIHISVDTHAEAFDDRLSEEMAHVLNAPKLINTLADSEAGTAILRTSEGEECGTAWVSDNWFNGSGPRGSIEETNQRRADFAAAVLHLLEAEEEWSADTLDEIARLARERDLAHCDAAGMFREGLPPPPPWMILTEWSEGDHPVKWEYKYLGDGEALHRITYGKQATETTSDTDAAKEFGYCVRHSLECIGAFSEGPR